MSKSLRQSERECLAKTREVERQIEENVYNESPAFYFLKESLKKMGLEWCATEIIYLKRELRKHEPKPKRKLEGLVTTAEIDAALSYQSKK